MAAICIIPARGGSRRIPLKNIKCFHGHPIIYYSIKVARESGLFDHIIVSTDNAEVAAIASSFKANVHNRDPAMADNQVGTQEVMQGVLASYPGYEEACCLYPCAPLLKASDIVRAAAILRSEGAEYVMSVDTSELQDAGAFYYGTTKAFLDGSPLYNSNTLLYTLPDERVCDINTHADWKRAFRLFKQL